jgi:hypothetical protein
VIETEAGPDVYRGFNYKTRQFLQFIENDVLPFLQTLYTEDNSGNGFRLVFEGVVTPTLSFGTLRDWGDWGHTDPEPEEWIPGENFNFDPSVVCEGTPPAVDCSKCPWVNTWVIPIRQIQEGYDRDCIPQLVLNSPPNDMIDRMRYILGYNGDTVINEKGIIPILEKFVIKDTITLAKTFQNWEGTFYFDFLERRTWGTGGFLPFSTFFGTYFSAPYREDTSGGMYEVLGPIDDEYVGRSTPPHTDSYRSNLWDDLGKLHDGWMNLITEVAEHDSTFYNDPVNYKKFTDIHDKIEEYRNEVGSSDGKGGIRGIIKDTMEWLENRLLTPQHWPERREALYAWKDRKLGNWHFVYVKISDFVIPTIREWEKTSCAGFCEKRCLGISYGNNMDPNWPNPLIVTIIRYDQQSSFSLSRGSLLWKFIYRKSPDAAITEPNFDVADKNKDGLLSTTEIINAHIEGDIKGLLLNYGIWSHKKASYFFVEGYTPNIVATCPYCYEYPVSIDLF